MTIDSRGKGQGAFMEDVRAAGGGGRVGGGTHVGQVKFGRGATR